MKISSITVYPMKISKSPVYLGTSSGMREASDYYIRPEYRSVYSRNLESLVVKITTDTGLVGWGEALAPVAPEVTGQLIKSLFEPLLLDANPLNVDVIWNKLYNSMRERGYFSGFMVDAITAVDMALWDILGKHLQVPVHVLLGGSYRTEIPAYVSGLPVTNDEERIQLALDWQAKGFKAIKLHLGYSVEEDARIVRQLREALGSSFRLMVDAHWKYSVPEAIRLGRMLESLGVEFLEAPVLPEDIDGTVEVARALDMAVAIGEAKRTRYQFKERLVRRAADIFQPDVGRAGISETRKIATMSEAFNIPIAPHLSVSLGICIAATLQVCASLSNFYILEFQPTVFPSANSILHKPLVCENGRYLLPTGVGLGVEVNEEAIKEHVSQIL
jgi:L-alanine-DL-glutamate epimerase-like enolase superfamily enzyme